MRDVDSRTGIEVLDRDQCLELLAEDVIGRLVVIAGGVPLVTPVNYCLDGESIVFRTDEGAKLSAAGRALAAFEIDSFDRETRTGWSVVVTGRLGEVTEYEDRLRKRLDGLGVDPWAGGEKPHLLRLVPTTVTGRRVSSRS
jgi:nitroimidazol reductase NimA-like FMN-containing flavoprotein (pyridoxamine 5'-phosphate oxidase superfamily)